MHLTSVLPTQIGAVYEPQLEQPGQEDARAREGVQDVYTGIGQPLAELFAENVVGAPQDEVHHLGRRIDDSQPFRFLLDRELEEVFIQFLEDLLSGNAGVQSLGSAAHAPVERFHVADFVLQAEFAELAPQLVQRPRDGVAAREVVPVKERIEHRPGQDVLGHHVDGVGFADRLVDRTAKLLVEALDPPLECCILGVGQQIADPFHQAREDVGDVSRPRHPILPVSAPLHDLRVDRLWGKVERREVELELFGAWVDDVDDNAFRPLQVDPVDLGVEAVVMRAKRPKDLPDGGEAPVVVERPVRRNSRRNRHGKHDVAVLLPFGLAHDPAHGLHDLDRRLAGRGEEHSVERGHVHALGKASGVAEDAAGAFVSALEPIDPGLALERPGLPVHMPGRAAQGALAPLLRELFDGCVDNPVPMPLQQPGRPDGVGKSDRPLERARGFGVCVAILRAPPLERPPAAHDLGGVGDVEFAAAAVGEVARERGAHPGLGHREDHDLIVGEQVALDGAGEGKPVELRAVGVLVVHREDICVVARRLCLGALGVDAWRGGHVEPLAAPDPLSVVDEDEGRGLAVAGTFDPSRAVRLVAEDQVEGRSALLLRPLHERQRVVGAEDDRHVARTLLPQRLRDAIRPGRDRDLKLHHRGVFAVASRAHVRTDADVAVRHRLLRGPLAHRLRKERNRRHQIEHAAARARDGFGDPKRREGLARAARHDELAPVRFFESPRHGV